ncbi:hypothetical protein [Burkholderia sp. Ac-20349]|uniref:hypothetical protein n=1 Tax=Burkholderia sp. Ac-20349 TaxID=2703893 RepID=UPI00197B8ACA|nr:hypothetical protein [Burkholderia sp. Ac-20349]MBN3839237.1 hypothetical protein [Burkholderia sp. Ac-20349]
MSASELVTLRFQSGGQLSGNDGRTVRKGIYWDDWCEAIYQGAAARLEFTDGKSREDAEYEAVDHVVALACGRALKREFSRARACATDSEKRALYADWKSVYGDEPAKRIAAGYRDEEMRERVFGGVGR